MAKKSSPWKTKERGGEKKEEIVQQTDEGQNSQNVICILLIA